MKMAILGAGGIAGTMASTIREMPEVVSYAVAARDYDRAKAFAQKYGFEKAYGSYEEMLGDGKVELVYIATPHSHHYEHIKLCLEHGKHVLCEKAFTANAVQAEEVLNLAKKKGLLLAEAIWTRYMPMRKKLEEVIAGGEIGKPSVLTANLGYRISHVPRMITPELAGGALLDLGVYPINFALMAFGTEIERISSAAVLMENGLDSQDSITFLYKDGKMAQLYATMLSQTDRQGVISGDRGYLVVENINNCERIRVYNLDRRETACYEAPVQISGYEYEVRSCIKAIQEGKLECWEMPHEEILRVMKLMDGLRAEWGIRFPFE